jgi:hypothetical protein
MKARRSFYDTNWCWVFITLNLVIGLILALSVASARGAELRWSFNPTNQLITFSFQVKSNASYSVVRRDMNTEYYDVVTNTLSTSNGVLTCIVNPLAPSDEDQPTPSGQCLFYLVERQW